MFIYSETWVLSLMVRSIVTLELAALLCSYVPRRGPELRPLTEISQWHSKLLPQPGAARRRLCFITLQITSHVKKKKLLPKYVRYVTQSIGSLHPGHTDCHEHSIRPWRGRASWFSSVP